MALYHTAKGSVDYTVVGSPTIVNGVVSGFSIDNYLSLTTNPSYVTTDSFEWNIKFTTGNSLQTSWLLSLGTSSIMCGIYYTSNGVLYVPVGSGSMYGQVSGLTANTQFEVNVKQNDGTLVTTLKSANGTVVSTQTKNVGDVSFTSNNSKFGQAFNGYFNGFIDLNETYIKVNGQPWFGLCPVEVKKHQLMGPVGYTVVGSPTINNGVMTNSDPSNYISIRHWEQYKPFEFAMKINTGTRPADTCWLVRSNGLLLYWKWDARLTFFLRDINNVQQGISGTTQLENNKDYWIKIIYDGTMASMYLSTDSQNYSLEVSQAISVITNDYSINIGSLRNTYPFTGSIDLNQTYIKVNGKLWFWQPQKSKYIVKDGKLVFADPGLYLTGPVNYEVVGSPAIVDGVASGFSADDYTKTSSSIDVNYNIVNGFDLQTRIKIPSYSSGLAIHYFTGSGGISSGLSINSAGKVYWLIGRDDTSETNISIGGGTTTIPLDTYYYIRLKISNKIATLYTSIDGALWNTESTLDMTEMVIKIYYNRPFGFGHAGISTNNNYIFNGSIDLNNTYIKVNDQLWFYGKNYATQNIAPVPSGYTFGTTTTPSIGYVDMRTQVFTAAPAGATVGRDL